MKYLSLILIALLGLCHYYASDLQQKNSEEIFMSASDYQSHQRFTQKLPAPDPIIIAGSRAKIEEVEAFIQRDFGESISSISANLLKQKMHDSQSLIPLIDSEGQEALILSPSIHLSAHEEQKMLASVISQVKQIDPSLAFAGVDYINFELDQSSRVIQTFLFPFTFVLCFVGLALILRSPKIALLIFLPSLLTTGLALALIKISLDHLDMVTSIIPLMIFVLNLTMGLHLALTRLSSKNINEVLVKKMRPILLMIATTAIGFGSLLTSDIPVIRSFAWLSSVLILVTHLIHALLVYPFYDSIYPRGYNIPSFVLNMTRWGQFRKSSLKRTLPALGVLVLIGILCAFYIPIHTQAAHYFNSAGPIIKGQEFIHQSFIGNPNLDILIKLDRYDYKSAQKLTQLEEKLGTITHDKVISTTALTIEANRLYSGKAELPSNSYAWAALLGQVPAQLKENLINDDYYKVSLLGPLKDTDEYFRFIQQVKTILEQQGYVFELGGLYYTLMLSQKNLIYTLAYSFSLSLIIMILLAYLFYPKSKILLCFSIVNLAPLALSLIGFKVLGLSFNVATVMTFSLSLGMIVDGTFHIIHAALSKESYEEVLTSTFGPIFISSSLLALCFMTFAPMDFLPIREFGIALALNCMVGLYFDLSLLPHLLSKLQISERWNHEREA